MNKNGLFIIWIFYTTICCAQGYNFTTYKPTGANAILGLACDSKYVYAGTRAGLARWSIDGSNYEYIKSPVDSIPYFGDLAFDNDGKLWCNQGPFLSAFRDGIFTTYRFPDSIKSSIRNLMCVDKKGNVWFALFNHGVALFNGANWQVFDSLNGLPTNDIRCIATDTFGNVCIPTGKGLYYYGNGSWSQVDTASIIGKIKSPIITFARSGAIWFMQGDRLAKLENSIITTWDKKTIWPIYQVVVDANSFVWYCCPDGVYRVDSDTVHHVLQELPDNFEWVTKMAADSAGGLFINTNGSNIGLRRWNKDSFVLYKKSEPTTFYYSIAIDSANNKWFNCRGVSINVFNGVDWVDFKESYKINLYTINAINSTPTGDIAFSDPNGFGIYHTNSWQIVDSTQGLLKYPFDFCFDSSGNIWFIIDGDHRGLSKVHNGTVVAWFDSSNGLPSSSINCLTVDREGILFVGTPKGIARYSNNVWTKIDTTNGLRSNRIDKIWFDSYNRMWVGNKGISIEDHGTWTYYDSLAGRLISGRSISGVKAIAETPDSCYFVSTDSTLFLFEKGKWTFIDSINGFPSKLITDIEVDRNGAIWFAGGAIHMARRTFASVGYHPSSLNKASIEQSIRFFAKNRQITITMPFPVNNIKVKLFNSKGQLVDDLIMSKAKPAHNILNLKSTGFYLLTVTVGEACIY
ncbi:MAG: hypothetical protein PHC61_07290, partial [Chitinivibrionales bacterium]|nr:hypothetical protein [Chitinivibrionales bacterium]